MKVLIVGGVAGGASAAARLRRLDESAEIVVFERGSYISYANCGLPYYIGEVIKDKEELVLQTPERMKERFNLDVRINSEVIKLNTSGKSVKVKNLVTNEIYEENYDKLILSPGAEPFKPNIPGVDSDRIYTLRSLDDMYKIKDRVDSPDVKRAVVVGAGFIGLEMAENLHKRGIKVTVVEMADHVIAPLDFDMASIVHQHLKALGIEFYLKDSVNSFETDAVSVNANLSSGRSLQADLVIMSIGVRPDINLLRETNIKLGTTGGIYVDKYMRTSDPDVYAVGDAVEVMDFISGKPALIPLAGPANKQGRIAANNIYGLNETYEGTQGTAIVKVFEMSVAVTGNNERILKKNGVEFEKNITHSPSHAGYYPGASTMAIKLLFDKNKGNIYGAQIIGFDGVDKRMDVIATAIRANMTVFDLEKLELSYAPPYSSAKDPVNMAGFVASNIIKGYTDIFHWDELPEIAGANAFLIDVRTPEEYELGFIKGAVNIPIDELRSRIGEIPRDKNVLIYCQVGLRAYVATRILRQKGFNSVKNLSGGYKTYFYATDKQSNEDIYNYTEILKNDEIRVVKSDEKSFDSCIAVSVDACGLQCPEPIMRAYKAINSLEDGQVLSIKSNDPAFSKDIAQWCDKTGNSLLSFEHKDAAFTALIRKESVNTTMTKQVGNNKTMVVFSGDLDKAIASFIIANGAAAMGRKVTMFFTFWGLNILRKPEKVSVKKDIFSWMFGIMMPRGSGKLSLSKMNMGGMGAAMIRFIMKRKNVASLESLLSQAIENGVELIACNMSMDIMGIKQAELIDGITIGGVATFLGSAEESDMSLFI